MNCATGSLLGHVDLEEHVPRVTPHVGQKGLRAAANAAEEHRRSLRLTKTVSGIAQTVYRGLDRVCARFSLTMVACVA